MARQKKSINQIPLFAPESGWTPPESLPDLSNELILSIDTETHDPNLLTSGPGFIRGDATLKGFSIATSTDKWYFPLSHPGDNYKDPQAAIAWLRDLCKDPERPWLMHNAMYDVEALDSIGVYPEGQWFDTMVNESLIDENQLSFSLDATALRRIGKQKNETLLKEAAAAFGVDTKGGIHALPAEYVGPYAEDDAHLLFGIWQQQTKILVAEGLMPVFDLESRLLKVIWAMRKQGVAIDEEECYRLGQQWEQQRDEHLLDLNKYSSRDIDIWAPESLSYLCTTLKIDIPQTEKGNPSFENEFLLHHGHPALHAVARARKYDKMRRDFIDVYIRDAINGRIHAQFHTTRKDDVGTRSGRLSSTNPNLQQVPARDPEFGPAIRKLYKPDEGAQWGKFDYSSQEPRITLHCAAIANLPGSRAEEFVERYRANPSFCQHNYANEILNIPRADAKDINLGITYGMGADKQAARMNKPVKEVYKLREQYDQALPFVKMVAKHYTELAELNGYSTTILGRRSRFPNKYACFKALNRAVQGSGADMMKMAMVTLYEQEGIVPLLTVHDEIGNNIYEPEHADIIVSHMENAIPLCVPMVVDPELGPSWGEVE